MKISKCKKCSTEMSSNAKVCPNCGHKPIRNRWWFKLIIGYLIFALISGVAAILCLPMLLDSLESLSSQIPTTATEPATEPTTQPTESPTEVPTEAPTEPPTVAPTEAPANQLDEFIGKPLPAFMAKVEELGYTATYFTQGVDYTDILSLYTEEDCESFLIGGIEEDPVAKTVVVDLLTKASVEYEEMENALAEKLEIGRAWIAAEKYGKGLYGDSFELHYFLGEISHYAEDENTWFLKAKCTIQGVDMVCEVYVAGTSDSPVIVSFLIY